MTTHKDEIAERLRDVRCNEVSPCLAIWTDEAADFIEQQASTIERMDWQPIASVPAGEHVLLYFPNGERGVGGIEAATVFPDNGDGLTGGWTHGGPNSGSDWEFCERPTHWMPLPEPPAIATPTARPRLTED